MIAQSWTKSTWEINNYGKYIKLFLGLIFLILKIVWCIIFLILKNMNLFWTYLFKNTFIFSFDLKQIHLYIYIYIYIYKYYIYIYILLTERSMPAAARSRQCNKVLTRAGVFTRSSMSLALSAFVIVYAGYLLLLSFVSLKLQSFILSINVLST